MSLPKYNELYGPFLKAISDGSIHNLKDIKSFIVSLLNISNEELLQRLPSGLQTVIDNRISWAKTFLKKAGLLENPSRGNYILTDVGRKALPDADHITNEYLKRYESFKNFIKSTNSERSIEVLDENQSPEEILEDVFQKLNASLAEDLMKEIMKLSPTDFEHLVVDLLKKMGYGNGLEDAGFVTQASNDGGIDGIIKEDQLGFSAIYFQAKQWAPDQTISRPEIQKFSGALREQNAQKGLFITTASFTKGAKESAESAGIVLINGEQLTKLMIKFNLGVSVEHVYEVKRIKTDYFDEGF